MSFLIFAARKLDIINRQNAMQYRLQELTRKLNDLTQYATNIADGSISMSDMMNTPATMFNRQLMFMMYSHNASIFGAQQQMAQMGPMIQQQMMQMPDPNAQAMYQNWVFQNLYKQQRELATKQETALLNQQEKELTQEKTKLETQLNLLQQELESVKKAEESGIKQFTPQYTFA